MDNKTPELDAVLAWVTSISPAVQPKRKYCEIYAPDNAFLRLNVHTLDYFSGEEWNFVMPGEEPFDLKHPSLVRSFFTAEQNSFDPPEQVWYEDIYPLSQVESLYPGVTRAILTFHEMGPPPGALKAYIHSLLQDPSLLNIATRDLPVLAVDDSPP